MAKVLVVLAVAVMVFFFVAVNVSLRINILQFQRHLEFMSQSGFPDCRQIIHNHTKML